MRFIPIFGFLSNGVMRNWNALCIAAIVKVAIAQPQRCRNEDLPPDPADWRSPDHDPFYAGAEDWSKAGISVSSPLIF
jgi:hypothetical protein